jgi:hypothetical protein
MLSQHNETSQGSTYFEQHQADLAELGAVLDLPAGISQSLEEAIAITQPWVKGDHTRPVDPLYIEPEQSTQLRPLYTAFGLTQATPMPDGHYDHIIIPGAVQRGNNGRLGFLRESFDHDTITSSDIVLLGGQRKVFGEVEASLIQADLEEVNERGIGSPWTDVGWPDIGNMQWETDFIRLAALKQLGPLAVRAIHLRLENADPIKRYEFEWRNMPLKLLHTLAIARANGEPRHTTEACIEDWVAEFNPAEGAHIGFIASSPHRARMAKRVMKLLGREDITWSVGGPAAVPGLGDHIFLGEIARNLYEDQSLQ